MKYFPQFEQPFALAIKVWTDPVITVLLLATAAFLIYVASTQKTAFKAVVLAWVILP
jgi:hypothetical protein